MAGLVAAAALVVGLLGGAALQRRSGPDTAAVVAAPLLRTDGTPAGRVLVRSNPDRMVCVLDSAPPGVRYSVYVTGDGAGRRYEVGTFRSEGPGSGWSTSLPIDGSAVREVVIRDERGTVRAVGMLPS